MTFDTIYMMGAAHRAELQRQARVRCTASLVRPVRARRRVRTTPKLQERFGVLLVELGLQLIVRTTTD
jgi:hypothetical protein